MKSQMKKYIAVVLIFVLLFSQGFTVPVTAAKITKLSSKKLKLMVGDKKKVVLKNNKKKTIWTVAAGKKVICLKNKKRNSVNIVALKAGTARVQVRAGKNKYTCIVNVKAVSTNVPSQMAQNTIKPVYSISPDITGAPLYTGLIPKETGTMPPEISESPRVSLVPVCSSAVPEKTQAPVPTEITENIPHQTQSCPTKSPLTEVSPSAEVVTSKPVATFIPEYSPTIDVSSKPMESSNPETEDKHLGIQTNILENIDNAEYDNDGYIKLTGIRVGNDQIAEKDITIDTDDNHVWILCGNLAIDQIGEISLYFQQSNVKYSVQYIEESFLSGQVNADVGYYKITALYEMEDKTVWYKDFYVLKETEKDSGDVGKLKELIKVQKETGKNRISSDINSSQYIWKNGRLDTILWDSLGIQGEMVLEGFDSLTHFGCNDNKIKYLQIRNCPQLECIRCNQNQLTDLDVTEGQSLHRLKCSNNRLKTLNIDSDLKLEYVDASGNELVNLNVQNNNHLQYLFVSFNRLAALDIQNNKELMELECNNNQLTDIDVSQNLKLTNLGCGGNQLSQLDVKGLVQLKKLGCYDNQLKDLNISQNINLEYLHCSRNQISTLYVDSNQQLTELYCESNGIQELNVAGNYKLRVLYCGNNKIKELNIQNNSELWCMACDKNPISTIDITNNHKLELFSYGDGDVPVTVIGQKGREFTSAYVGWGTGSPDEDW